MATRVLNTAAITLRMDGMSPAMEKEMGGELDALAQLVARRMRLLAPKYRSLLETSVRIEKTEPLVRDIGPTTRYAEAQEEGIKPGGKGLPNPDDPAAYEIIQWLRKQAFSGRYVPRKGSRAAVNRELQLRDRYYGLAWHIRHKGMKATPFVDLALEQMRPLIDVRLQAAGERAINSAGDVA